MANASSQVAEKKRQFRLSANARRAVFPPAYSAAARMLCYTLTLGRRDDWRGLTKVLAARLSPQERAELARAALQALDDTEFADIVRACRAER